MIHAKKELDLLRSYRRLMRGEKGRSGLLHHFLTPAAACLLVCVLIWGVLSVLVGTRFQVLFHSPPGVLFTFPSRYCSTIGH